MNNLKLQLALLEYELGLVTRIRCSSDEEKGFELLVKSKKDLPDDIYTYEDTSGYYRILKSGLTEDETSKLLAYRQVVYSYRQLAYLRSIKTSMIFFVILVVISLIIAIITVISTYNKMTSF